MSVRTTHKTFDPHIILKARDLIKLLARGVAITQAQKDRFVKRRQRIIGPDGSTLKAIELLTQCYILVQGNIVSVMVLDCMKNIHPIYRIKKGTRKRFQISNRVPGPVPPHVQEHLKTSEKTMKKNGKVIAKEEARKASGLDASSSDKKEKPAKKVYTPFPPPQQLRKVDLQLESGEYFLKPHEWEAREVQQRKQKQAEATLKRRAEWAEVYVAPTGEAAPTVEEK
ncbi:uncharacterized protein BJ212DRAFT_1489336 [Suillus subaureus]|uniref:KRR1 small subunit processome component second KH domain-containing protein n=1 Tax=Suillus subaureus TaxID=48587 RepID=A0A9P7AXB4_9AGAM|nr:uncharacterized protein BJ212DRAFT_1489336 [Suillus subaureus]KAG1796475.1 hypothetical protein BJ212DRAFT_1489336 [Suillus subaureus]